MTTGNFSSELTSTQDNTPPQVSEYCLLFLKETRFLLLDVNWLFELFKSKSELPNSALPYLVSIIKFEDFLDQSLSNEDTTFIHELLQPAMDDNTLSDKLYVDVCCLAEKLYLEIHAKICDALVGSNLIPENEAGNDFLRLVGFFATTAIVSIGDQPTPIYPTFEEAYGRFGVTKWRDSVSRVPVLETFIPFVQGHCSDPAPF